MKPKPNTPFILSITDEHTTLWVAFDLQLRAIQMVLQLGSQAG